MQLYIDYISGRVFEFDIQTGNISGSGTANEISYFTGANSIGSLTTTIYPSLTELSYIKGVTSSVQTQINAKQNQLNGTGFVKAVGTTISYDNTSYISSIVIGTIDSQTKSANGLVVSGNTIVAQTADASSVGMVSIGTQTFSGAKTFSNAAISSLIITSSSYSTSSNGGHLSITPTITATGTASVSGINLAPTISAGANNTTLIGLNINPTLSAGAFTGVNIYDINLSRNTPKINVASGTLTFSFAATNTTILRAEGILTSKLKLGNITGTPTNALDVGGDSLFSAASTGPATATARVQIVGSSASTGSALIVSNSTPTNIIRADNNQDLYLGSSGGKVGFFAVTPILRPTTAITGATYVGGVGSPLKTDDTFGGYTLAKVVQALINLGLLT